MNTALATQPTARATCERVIKVRRIRYMRILRGRALRHSLAMVREVQARRSELGACVTGSATLGDAVVQIRTTHRYSQAQICQRSRVSRRRMRAIESGDDASAEELVGLAVALDVSPAGLAALPPGRTKRPARITVEQVGQLVLPGFPGALSWDTVAWRQDGAAQDFVDAHPDGATVEEIAVTIGVSTRWVERVLAVALVKMRDGMDDDD